MRTVILCNRLKTLQRLLPPVPEPFRFLILEDNQAGFEIREYLQRRGHAEEVPRATLNRARSARVRAAYVEAIGLLNAEQASLRWWAMPFTTKNPIATRLCRDTFGFLLIVDLVREQAGLLVVITDSETVAGQVEYWGKTERILVTHAVKPLWTLKQSINRLVLLALALRVLRALWFKLWIRPGIPKSLLESGADVLIVTLVHPSSIGSSGEFQDTYFGGLSELLRSRQVSLCVAGIVNRLSISLAQRFRRGSREITTVPLDALPRVTDILRCGWHAWQSYHESCDRRLLLEVGGLNIECLLHAAVQEAHTSGNVFLSLCIHRAACELASQVRVVSCVYPYENRAWEKMLLLGIRAASPQTRMVGYQHASITPSHTNFLLAEKEAEVTPFPDAIVAMGEVTREWLVREGHYPPSLVKTGCALRQSRSGRAVPRKRRAARPSRILVVLATSLSEYVQTLAFLQEAVKPTDGWDICIRPHPTIRLHDAIRLLPHGHIQFAYVPSHKGLSDDLAWADVVVYASSTVGLEAVGVGLPAVYLDLGDILGTDPMDGWTEFKWIAREPDNLRTVLAEIETIPDVQYERLQQKGLDYVDAYLFPVTDRNRQVFYER